MADISPRNRLSRVLVSVRVSVFCMIPPSMKGGCKPCAAGSAMMRVMARAKKYWLMKCEPEAYTIEDLERDGTTTWEGVRNFQARNYMRDDMKPGDGVLFYASNAEPSGVTGVAEIARGGYPDPYAFQKGHKYFDPKSDPQNPTWMMVDLRFAEKFPDIVPLEVLKKAPALQD